MERGITILPAMEVVTAIMRKNQEKTLVKNRDIDGNANADVRTWARE